VCESVYMKTLNSKIPTHGIAMAAVHDYQSGVLIDNVLADWTQYRLWAEGPSDVCQACRCLSEESLVQLGIGGDTTIFLLDA